MDTQDLEFNFFAKRVETSYVVTATYVLQTSLIIIITLGFKFSVCRQLLHLLQTKLYYNAQH